MGIDARPTLTLCSPNSRPETSTKLADAAELRLEEQREGKLIELLFAAKNLAEFQIRRFDGALRCAECKAEQDPSGLGRSHGMFCRVGHTLDILAALETLNNTNGSQASPAPTLIGASAAGGPFLFAAYEGARCECEADCCGTHDVYGCGTANEVGAYTVGPFLQKLCAHCAEAARRHCLDQGLEFVDHSPAPIGGAA